MSTNHPPYTISETGGTTIGLKFAGGYWYRWSSRLNAYALCDQKNVTPAVLAIVNAMNTVDFDSAIAGVLNIGGNRASLQ